MSINRNNYEEYFLMYADNELSQTEKIEVEEFARVNADLTEEFEMIQLTINIPDENQGLGDKSFLKKKEAPSFINEANCSEIFVLYHDNELHREEKKLVNDFLKHNPKYHVEFELIGKSKLTSDEQIVFPEKESLYRKGKSGKVIPALLFRSLAAAVLAGFGIWVVASYFSDKQAMRALVIGDNSVPFSTSTLKSDLKNGFDPATESSTSAEIEIAAHYTKKENVNDEQQGTKAIAIRAVKKEIFLPQQKVMPATREETAIFGSDDLIKEKPDHLNATLASNNSNEHIDKIVTFAEPETYAKNASYIDNNSNDENYVFYNVKASEFNKSKVGGFLKKVKRVVERTNPIGRLLSGEEVTSK